MPQLRGLRALVLLAVWLPAVGNPADLLTVASVLAVSVAILLIWQPAPDRSAPMVRVRARTLRLRAQRLAFLPARDPDADGRVRPRAPGQRPAAT